MSLTSTRTEAPRPITRYRVDLQLIARLVKDGSTVLDLGCGDGELMELLVTKKHVRATGVEISEEGVYHCIQRGLSVQHADLDEGLGDYLDGTFDYVILSQTLQAVRKPRLILCEMLRVGRLGIVSFPNFGHWRVRWEMVRTGRMPKTKHLPYEWYDTPNIHLSTVRDFEDLCKAESIRIRQAIYLTNGRRVRKLANLRAETALFVVEGPGPRGAK